MAGGRDSTVPVLTPACVSCSRVPTGIASLARKGPGGGAGGGPRSRALAPVLPRSPGRMGSGRGPRHCGCGSHRVGSVAEAARSQLAGLGLCLV